MSCLSRKLINHARPFMDRWRAYLLGLKGAEIGRHCQLGAGIDVDPGFEGKRHGRIRIGPYCRIERGVVMYGWGGRIDIGRETFLGPHTVIYGHGDVRIGKHCLIAMHSCIVSSNHQIPDRSLLIRQMPNDLLPVVIEDDVWLGAGVTVLGGVTIGTGSVVGAGAVVTQSLPPYTIAYGVPARIVGSRK